VKQRQDEAYVLTTRELGEADVIVSLFGRQTGKLRGVARGARRSRKRFGGALAPLTRVRAMWGEREGRELQQIEALDVERSFAEMQADPVRQAACAVLVELSEVFAREGEPDPKSYDLLGAVLEALELEIDVWSVIHYFEFWLLRLHGLAPALAACGRCGRELGPRSARWAERSVGLACTDCRPAGARRLQRADVTFLEQCRRLSPRQLEPAAAPVGRPGGALDTLLRGTLESFAERSFRSYRHLATLTAASPVRGGSACP